MSFKVKCATVAVQRQWLHWLQTLRYMRVVSDLNEEEKTGIKWTESETGFSRDVFEPDDGHIIRKRYVEQFDYCFLIEKVGEVPR